MKSLESELACNVVDQKTIKNHEDATRACRIIAPQNFREPMRSADVSSICVFFLFLTPSIAKARIKDTTFKKL